MENTLLPKPLTKRIFGSRELVPLKVNYIYFNSLKVIMSGVNNANHFASELAHMIHSRESHEFLAYSEIVRRKWELYTKDGELRRDLNNGSIDAHKVQPISNLLAQQDHLSHRLAKHCYEMYRIIRVLRGNREFSVTDHNDYEHLFKFFHDLVIGGGHLITEQRNALHGDPRKYESLYKKEMELFHESRKRLAKINLDELEKRTEHVINRLDHRNLSADQRAAFWLPLLSTAAAFFVMAAITGYSRKAYFKHLYNLGYMFKKLRKIRSHLKNF